MQPSRGNGRTAPTFKGDPLVKPRFDADAPSNQALALRVHLSPSACLRHVKVLEDNGVIAQYVALLNPWYSDTDFET